MATSSDEVFSEGIERRERRALVERKRCIGQLLANGQFQPHTNFTVKVMFAVQSPEGAANGTFGFVYQITTTDDQQRCVLNFTLNFNFDLLANDTTMCLLSS